MYKDICQILATTAASGRIVKNGVIGFAGQNQGATLMAFLASGVMGGMEKRNHQGKTERRIVFRLEHDAAL